MSRNSGGQGVVRYSGAVEDAKALVAEPPPADSIEVKNGRMRGQAGTYCGVSVALCPIQQCCEASPIGFLGEICRLRLGASYYEPVDMTIPQIAHIGIEGTHTTPAYICPGDAGQGIESQAHHDAVRSGVKQCTKLA